MSWWTVMKVTGLYLKGGVRSRALKSAVIDWAEDYETGQSLHLPSHLTQLSPKGRNFRDIYTPYLIEEVKKRILNENLPPKDDTNISRLVKNHLTKDFALPMAGIGYKVAKILKVIGWEPIRRSGEWKKL